jgi:hypothetical protein
MAATPELPVAHPREGEGVKAALRAVYNWNYQPEIDQVRNLYANALERQWIALRDLDWSREVDREAFSKSFTMGGIPVDQTDFWQRLPVEKKWEISRRSAAFMLSNFLHGEQGALFIAGQLVNAVPHMDAKFYAATQTLDEARHVEVFAAYIQRLDHVFPIAPALKQLLDRIIEAESWLMKVVGMQIVVEGLALYVFRDMRNTTQEPLLKQLLTYVSRDEARHTGYGVKYLSHVVPTLGDREKAELEDFGFETARLLVDSRTGATMRDAVLGLWKEVGFDPVEVVTELAKERDKIRAAVERNGGRAGPITGFILPTMRGVGLASPRIVSHFEEMLVHNNGPQARALLERVKDLPEDLEAWVLADA